MMYGWTSEKGTKKIALVPEFVNIAQETFTKQRKQEPECLKNGIISTCKTIEVNKNPVLI